MAERQPIPIPDPQRASHEGGNGALGIPPVLQERAKPPPGGAAHGRSEVTSVQQPLERRGAVFDCVVPAITNDEIRRHDSLYVIRERLFNRSLTKIQAERLEQKWRERLRRMDRLTLQEKLYYVEEALEESKQLQKEGALTADRQALIPEEEEEVEVLREELRQRKAD